MPITGSMGALSCRGFGQFLGTSGGGGGGGGAAIGNAIIMVATSTPQAVITDYAFPTEASVTNYFSVWIMLAAGAAGNATLGIFARGNGNGGTVTAGNLKYNVAPRTHVMEGTLPTQYWGAAFGNLTHGYFQRGSQAPKGTSVYTYSNGATAAGAALATSTGVGATAVGSPTGGIVSVAYTVATTNKYSYSSSTYVVGTVLALIPDSLTSCGNSVQGLFASRNGQGTTNSTMARYIFSSDTSVVGKSLGFYTQENRTSGCDAYGLFFNNNCSSNKKYIHSNGAIVNATKVYNLTPYDWNEGAFTTTLTGVNT